MRTLLEKKDDPKEQRVGVGGCQFSGQETGCWASRTPPGSLMQNTIMKSIQVRTAIYFYFIIHLYSMASLRFLYFSHNPDSSWVNPYLWFSITIHFPDLSLGWQNIAHTSSSRSQGSEASHTLPVAAKRRTHYPQRRSVTHTTIDDKTSHTPTFSLVI